MKQLISVTLIGLSLGSSAWAAGSDVLDSHSQPGAWSLFGDDRSSTSLGIGAAYMPEYEGADSQRWRALPLIDIQRGRFFAGTTRGIGVDLSPNDTLQIGPRLTYRGSPRKRIRLG